MNLFYLKGVLSQIEDGPGCEPLKKVTMSDIWMASLPYVLAMYVVIALVLVFPEIAIWLPTLMQ